MADNMSDPRLIKHSHRGFTLVEVLVSLAILSVIMVALFQYFSNSIRFTEKLTGVQDRFQTNLFGWAVIQRDLTQLTDRAVRDRFGTPDAALSLTSNNNLKFTSLDLFQEQYSDLSAVQRIEYSFDQQQKSLLRSVLQHPDSSPSTEILESALLTDVESLEMYAIDESGQSFSYWPKDTREVDQLPFAIGIKVQIDGVGEILRYFPVNGG